MSSRSGPTVARQATLRSQNLALATAHVFAAKSSVARVDIAKATGMTRSTASRLIDELIGAGFLTESSPVQLRKPGRPAVPLSPGANRYFTLGLQLDVTHLSAVLVDLTGAVVASADEDHDHDRPPEPATTCSRLAALGRTCLDALPEQGQLCGIAIALPGIVDSERHMLLQAPNLGWRDVEIVPLLRAGGLVDLDDVPHGLINEAAGSATVIAREAPGRKSHLDSFLYVSGAIGIGAALVHRGRVIMGERGWAGEIGHTCIDADGPVCRCGASGCLERYAGTDAMLAMSGRDSLEALMEGLADGDEACREAVAVGSRALGIAVANACNLLDVSTVVLGGDLARLSEHHIPAIMGELDRRLLTRAYADASVTVAPVSRFMAAKGSAYLAIESVIADPARWIPDATERPA